MARIIDLVTNAGQVDVTRGIVEEALAAVPEMAFFDADVIAGIAIIHRSFLLFRTQHR